MTRYTIARDPRVLTTDTLMEPATLSHPRRCLYCSRPVGQPHVPACVAVRDDIVSKPHRPKYRFSGVE
jgi:hypothetical protein